MTILIVIAIIIALPLVIALFVKKNYALERSITINKPVSEVFDFARHLKNEDKYSVWVQADPNMKREFSGVDGTVGFTSAWDSANKSVGKGTQTIVNIVANERVDKKLHFIKPFEGLADAYMATSAQGANATKVAWGMSSSMKYPMNFMLLFMNMDKMLGKDMETGLSNMKNVLEKK